MSEKPTDADDSKPPASKNTGEEASGQDDRTKSTSMGHVTVATDTDDRMGIPPSGAAAAAAAAAVSTTTTTPRYVGNYPYYEGGIPPEAYYDHPSLQEPQFPDVSGRYASLLKIRYRRETENSAVIPLPRRTIGGLSVHSTGGGSAISTDVTTAKFQDIKACQCSRGNCLKLYCECFRSGTLCTAQCACPHEQGVNSTTNGGSGVCRNDGAPEHGPDRNRAILNTLDLFPHAFRVEHPTVRDVMEYHEVKKHLQQQIQQQQQQQQQQDQHMTSHLSRKNSKNKKKDGERVLCSCRKSRCLKKYCECFASGLFCQPVCTCTDCQNVKGNKSRSRAILRQQQFAELKNKTKGSKETGTTSSIVANDVTNVVHKVKKNLAKLAADGVNMNTPASSAELATAPDIWNSLPPSMTADPMVLPNNCITVKALSFTHSAPTKDKKRKASSNEVGELGAGALLVKKVQPSQDAQVPKQKEADKKWAIETIDVLGTFNATKQELLRRKEHAASGLQEGDIALSKEYSYYDILGSAHTAAVELELADIVTSVREAGDRARNLLKEEEKAVKDADALDSMEVDDDKKDASNANNETTIVQAAEDAAMMRELARIIRQRALEMKEARCSEYGLIP